MKKTLYIPTENVADFTNTVAKFNKRLAKNDVAKITCNWGERTYLAGFDKYITEVEVEIPEIVNLKNDVPYYFIGTVSMEDGNKFYNAINCDSELFRNAEIKCECCGKKIERKKSIVMSTIEKPTSSLDLKFFGTTCAKDYFDINIEWALEYFEKFFETVEEECGACEDSQCCFHDKSEDVISLDELIEGLSVVTDDFTRYVSTQKSIETGLDSTKDDFDHWRNGK